MTGSDLMKRPSYPPVPVTPKRESEALIPAAFRSVRRNRHASVPLAAPPVMWMAGEILRAFTLAPETAAAGAVAGIAVYFFAPHKWDRPAEQWYARLSVLGAGTYLSLAAGFGASSGLSGEILGGVLVAGGIAWGVPWWRHYRPRGRRRRQKMLARWDAWWQGHCWDWSLGGSRVIDATEHRVTVRLRVQLMPGRQSVHHVQQAVHLIESGLQGIVEVGRVRVEVVKGNPSQVDLFFKQENPLAQVVEWDPALAPRSVHEEAVDGLSETGQWKTTPMRVNAFVIGKTRSGKSNHLLVRVAQLTGCPDDRQVVIDLKGGRSGRPLIETGAVDYVITGTDEACMYLLMLCAEIKARAKHCYDGEEQVHATAQVPAIHTLIDETHGLTSVAARGGEAARLLAIIASQGSGLEVYAEVYTQYGALEDSVQTEQTRSNLALRVVYAVEEARHGAFAIPEYSKFDASRLEEKGTHLMKIGPKAFPEQVRAPKMSHELLKSIVAANARRLIPRPPWVLYCGDEPCPAGGTWQEWWDSRWLRLDPAFRKISPQYAEAAGRVTDETAQAPVPDESGVIIGPAQTVTFAPAPSAPGEGDGASVAARIEAESAGGVPDDFTPPRRAVSRLGAVVREQKEAWADALTAASGGISPDQLCAESGMGRTWSYDTLRALLGAGVVTRAKRGLYAPVPGADIRQAVEAVEDGNELLLRQARRQVRRAVS